MAYQEVSKGFDGTGLEKFVKFSGTIQIVLPDNEPVNSIENKIQVLYDEYYKQPDGTIVGRVTKSYYEVGERASRWAGYLVPGTELQLGYGIIAGAIATYLQENLIINNE